MWTRPGEIRFFLWFSFNNEKLNSTFFINNFLTTIFGISYFFTLEVPHLGKNQYIKVDLPEIKASSEKCCAIAILSSIASKKLYFVHRTL